MSEDKFRDYLKRATADLRHARQRIRELEDKDGEPIAIVGIGCRFPGGVRNADDLWRLLAGGHEVVDEFPTNRGWDLDDFFHPDPDHPGTSYTRHGAFLADADQFDPDFFGISPREALAMDPQQRHLLETTWETLENAGIDPTSLRGSDTGVFTGIISQDYAPRREDTDPSYEGYLITGTTSSVASGRVAYTLGLRGPAISVDTACSSSLVATHLACRALRDREIDLAIAGGATIMTKPGIFVELGRQRGLAPDGRCKPFSADADGTAFAEGVATVALERLSDARRAGHTVLAVIRGTAINQDGASNGLTAPHGPAQQRVIHQALTNAGLTPNDIDAIEAHGTGTTLGDPIEAGALLATYGQHRDRPLWLGALKSNIGHTQAAAGVAGLIKMVLALRHDTLPATLHAGTPSPHIAWHTGEVRLLTEAQPWPGDPHRPRRAGISSFGISGTNAHLIVEEAPAATPADGPAGGPLVWPLSAHTDAALAQQASNLADYLTGNPGTDPAHVAATLARRTVLDRRAVLVGDTLDDLRAGLRTLPIRTPDGAQPTGKTVFVFPGQGSQWVGMGAELIDQSAAFAEAVSDCERAFQPHVDWSLTETLRHGTGLDRVDVVQPALFAVMVGLARLWQSVGVRPDAVIGHSQGEIAAAHVAGALTLEDAASVVILRARAIALHLAGRGGMASIPLPPNRIDLPATLHVAAHNSPNNTVVAGDPTDLEALVDGYRAQDVQARLIDVDYASHTPHVEGIQDELARVLAGITPRPPAIPFYSTVTASRLDVPPDAGYWYRNLRHTVHFEQTVRALAADGHTTFVETSPHPVLLPPIQDTLPDATAIGTLRRDQGDLRQFHTAAATAHVNGTTVTWPADGPVLPLPTYPFQHDSYWLRGTTSRAGHPLLAGPISTRTHPWLADHAVSDSVLLPGTAFLDIALHAIHELPQPHVISDLTLEAPLVLTDEPTSLHLTVNAPEGALAIHSHDGTAWTRHVSATIAPAVDPPPVPRPWTPSRPLPVADLYERLADHGYHYGPTFQGLTNAWRDGDTIHAEITLPEGTSEAGHAVHPALLDAALHPLLLDVSGAVELPFSWTGVRWHNPPRARSLHATITLPDIAVAITRQDGTPVLTVDSLVTRPVPAQVTPHLHQLVWTPRQGTATEDPDVTVVDAPDGDDTATSLCELLDTLQDWISGEHATPLVIITHGAVAVADEPVNPTQAALAGLVRSAQAEHPGQFLLVDLDGREDSRAAVAASVANGDERVAIRRGVPHTPRIDRYTPPATLTPPRGNWRLGLTEAGSLDNVTCADAPATPLSGGQVRVAVRAVGLNFRDVLIALGMYPDPDAHLGSEAAGVVVEAGPGAGYAPGDAVMGIFADGVGPTAVTDHRLLAPVPAGWGFTAAATAPIAYLTACYALRDLAGVRAGESVLIHAATGGVGTAARALAAHWGVTVLATASTGKHATLRADGLAADHLASSRDLGFEQRFLATTGGRGVDVVLNSLTNEFVDASLRLLPSGGRFVELGKADLRDPDRIAADHPGVTYRPFDLMDAGHDRIHDLLAELGPLWADGTLPPLPRTTWPVHQAPDALRHLSQARHIGKVTLTFDDWTTGTVLVTGGTGTLGRLVARHLVERHGVRHLLLVSRRGPDTPGIDRFTAELIETGASPDVVACDVTDAAALAALLASVPASRPLTAVIHAAGTTDDATLTGLTPAHVDRVLGAKVTAADHLDRLTDNLDHFVLFSSAAGVLGAPGQANYAAANAYLDALAQRRRHRGQPATAIAWGLWAQDSDLTGRLDERDRARLRRGGVTPMSTETALGLLDTALHSRPATVIAARLDTRARRPGRATGSLAGQVAALPESDREHHVLTVVRTHVAAVLGRASADSVSPEQPFKDIGFDSLTAVELRNRLKAATGLRLPAALAFDHPTPRALTTFLLDRLADARSSAPRPVATSVAPAGEPIAIVGMGCRFPGEIRDPDGLWAVLAAGVDVIGEFPTNRGWDLDRLFHADPDHPGTSYTRLGGFLHDADQFDPEFFGISPREALAMDPQQRLLLETTWHTLENAGIDPHTLSGSNTGVFVGLITQDYAPRHHETDPSFEGYFVTGTTSSVASGRVAYTLGLRGPALTVDTACSSSLVATHLAAQALRSGECDLAIAGGVTVMTKPAIFVELSRQRGLAPDGRCKAFSAAADGTAFSEGVGLILLERLSDARRNGHEILAVVRGSAVNQDGASNGLTAPNGPSQQRVVRQALANAGLSPADVDAVEAHGTGTTLGDPIEAGALLDVYGPERDRPLWLGSLKSNLGHTQAAAGVAGIIKTVLALRHGTLPATLHVDEPTPHVDWTAGGVELLTASQPWPADPRRPRRAGISSFGISGTNAHVIVEEPPPAPAPTTTSTPADEVWLVSARSPSALRDQARGLAGHDADIHDIANSLATRRAHLPYRAAVVGTDRKRLTDGLRAIASSPLDGSDELPAFVRTGRVDAAGQGKTVFVFPGQGAQWLGMGGALYAQSPAFAESIDACERELAKNVDWSLLDVLRAEPDAAPLARVEVVQPVLFSIMVSLAALWQSMGVRPDAVIGHSQGEIAAAYVAGALSLEDAMLIVTVRSKLGGQLVGRGSLMSVAMGAEDLARHSPPGSLDGDDVSVAAINGPHSTILSGDLDPLDRLLAHYREQNIRARLVPAAWASHGPKVEPLREVLAPLVADVRPGAATVPFYSTVTATRIDTTILDGEYWYRNMREPVLFQETVRNLVAHGHSAFIELSPHPVLGHAVQDILDEDGADGVVLESLRRDDGGHDRFLLSLANAHTHGVAVDWARHWSGATTTPVPLPDYPFQHESFWLRGTADLQDVTATGLDPAEHPLLRVTTPLGETGGVLFAGSLSSDATPWLADHGVLDTTLLPGTALLELALHAGRAVGAPHVRELTLHTPLVVPPHVRLRLHVVVHAPDDQGVRELVIRSRADDEWVRHAVATLTPEPPPAEPVPAWAPPEPAEVVPVDGLYADLAERGYHHGPAFHGLRSAWRHENTWYAEVTLPAEESGYLVHPALLDAALHPLLLEAAGEIRLPFCWNEVRLHNPARGGSLRVRIGMPDISVTITEPDGTPVLTAESLLTRPLPTHSLTPAAQHLHRLTWTPRHTTTPVEDYTTVDAPDTGDVSAATHQLLATLQDWVAENREEPLVVVTRGAVAVDGEPVDPVQAALWGLVRSAQTEHPGQFVLLDTDDPAGRLTVPGGHDRVASRRGVVHTPKLAGYRPADEDGRRLAPEGTVLITGGTGTLGGLVARHLAEHHGVRHLLLVSRSGRDAPGAGRLATELTDLGARVDIAACDVADPDALGALLSAIPAEHPLTAVVHAAGTIADAVLTAQTPEHVDAVFRPKVTAAANLDRLTRDLPLTHFVLFSSAAGVLGGPGQANYAAANAYLDGLAQQRTAAGRVATSIAWGFWAETSDLTGRLSDRDRARLRRGGILPMATETALALLDISLAAAPATVVAAHLDTRAPRTTAAEPGAESVPLTEVLAGLDEEGQHHHLLTLLRGHVAAVLARSDPDSIHPDQPFRELGFDSLTAVELRNRFNRVTGLRLLPTLVFDHPTPRALAIHLRTLLAPETPSASELVLSELDRLDSALDAVSPDDADRQTITGRLRAMLDRWQADAEAEPEVRERLATASNSELFSFIDDLMGRG